MKTLRFMGLVLLAMLVGCSDTAEFEPGTFSEFDDEEGSEGAFFDAEFPDYPLKDDSIARSYTVPEWVEDTQLVSPEIIVSLDGLTVHLFDRGSRFSRVYPSGVGRLNTNGSGRSITPTGFFHTGSDVNDPWWYISDRHVPAYYGGFPFIRLTTLSWRGSNSYGLHGPITAWCDDDRVDFRPKVCNGEWQVIRGYVSSGCMRMRAQDIVELFHLIKDHPSVPVTIQRAPEKDRYGITVRPAPFFDAIAVDRHGNQVRIDQSRAWNWPSGWDEDDEIVYGELGTRPN